MSWWEPSSLFLYILPHLGGMYSIIYIPLCTAWKLITIFKICMLDRWETWLTMASSWQLAPRSDAARWHRTMALRRRQEVAHCARCGHMEDRQRRSCTYSLRSACCCRDCCSRRESLRMDCCRKVSVIKWDRKWETGCDNDRKLLQRHFEFLLCLLQSACVCVHLFFGFYDSIALRFLHFRQRDKITYTARCQASWHVACYCLPGAIGILQPIL